MVNVGKYTSPMDPMGKYSSIRRTASERYMGRNVQSHQAGKLIWTIQHLSPCIFYYWKRWIFQPAMLAHWSIGPYSYKWSYRAPITRVITPVAHF